MLVLVFGVPLLVMRAMIRTKTMQTKAPIMMWSRNLSTGLLSIDRFIVAIVSMCTGMSSRFRGACIKLGLVLGIGKSASLNIQFLHLVIVNAYSRQNSLR
jgi:hypothetical protein